jgi:tetraacyldisaccharide 4'-kinase
MLTPSQFRDLVSGRRRGVAATMLRCGLRLAEVPYTWAVTWRNRRYDRGTAAIERMGVPTVSVGNLTLGGTGKTPLVEWIARWFLGDCPNFRPRDCPNFRGHHAQHGRENGTVPFTGQGDSPVFADTKTGTVPVAIISRGYGAKAGEANDEALELQQRLPDVPHLQNPDRVAAARQAIAELGCRVIVLDDAFQHRRIGRDLDIVLLDALEPFGYGHIFPRGTLREPLAGLRRAHVVALSRADMLEPSEREAVRRHAQQLAPQADWIEIAHTARGLVAADGREEPLDALRDKPVAAFCGLGNPAGFRHTLSACGYRVVGFREFPDHYRYTLADLESLADWSARLGAAALLCTQKDLVKLAGLSRRTQSDCVEAPSVGATVALSLRDGSTIASPMLLAVRVGIEFLAGREVLESRLRAL